MDRTQLTIAPHFTKPGTNALNEVAYELRTSVIKEPDGSVIFEMKGVAVPCAWSQLATDIIVSKYFRKKGPNFHGETTAAEVVHRIARTIADDGQARGYFASKVDAEVFYQELCFLMIHQYGAFNSPVWFNVGLFAEYGIRGQGGNWAWDDNTETVFETETAYTRPQASACFIQTAHDDLMGIYELLKNEARLFKYGSGTGTNFSAIRGRQEKLSGGGTSSGLLSFLEVFDRAAGSTKSGGTTRRAAKLVCLNMDHPEIVEFIDWKMREEKKAHALIAAGYPSDFNGEAYHTISGQNSNNSVRVTDAFMDAVEGDAPWCTIARTTGEVIDTYGARDLWNKVAEAAWHCADPGVMFDTTINSWNTCSNTGRINAANPCIEFMFLDDTACNLASVNLLKFYVNGIFDLTRYVAACRVFFVAQEILVDLSSYPTKTIAKNSHDFRPLGLGYANLGGLLMEMGVAYDSDRARSIAASLTAIMTGTAYQTSVDLAQAMGPFAGYEANREPMLAVIDKHLDHARHLGIGTMGLTAQEATFAEEAASIWENTRRSGQLHGFRNAQATVLAPTGTIGLLMDCATTGVEPDFSLVKYKKLAGGGTIKIVNQSVKAALQKLGYGLLATKSIMDYAEANDTVEGAPYLRQSDYPVFACANRCGPSGTQYIRPMAHVEMMAAVQPFLSGAISKTVNLPNEATVDDVREIYEAGHRMGLKAIALYRDGCKLSQPLTSGKKSVTEVAPPMPVELDLPPQPGRPQGVRVRLPKKRQGFTQEARVGGHKIFLRTGEYEDGSLGEIFIDLHKEGAAFRSLASCFAMAVSIGLQYGVPLQTYVKLFTFTRFEPQGNVEGHANVKMATSIVDYIFRALGVEYLKQYDLAHVKPASPASILPPIESPPRPEVEKGEDAYEEETQGDAPLCDVCGHMTVRNAACFRCLNCGNSMGCS